MGVSGLPTGTVTFLFTDLEASTRLWEEQPEAMRAALARHDEILRVAVADHGGAVVKTTGDGLHAAFDAAEGALRAASAGQLGLASESWEETGPLRVRMGIHSGGAEFRDGDYFGPALNRAARLMAVAHGGQVLVSLATEELVRDSLDAELALVGLGEHRLRDLSRPERVFQLEIPGLPNTFPAIRSLDAFPGNLPVQVSSFIGRTREVQATVKALGESRVVTLTGVGGVGKTRLAVQVAGEVLPAHADGAWLCELASAADAEAMVQLIAATLGVQPRQGVSLAGSIREYLEAKRLLLVLDNCEHLLDPAGRIAEDVLHACPQVRILATSREGLGIEGEQIRVVRSLGLPEVASATDETLTSDAVRLFADRAYAAAGDFVLDASQAGAVAEVCRRLDGVPLAIELAAARVAVMSPQEIGTRLDERFRLLTGGRRTAVERHQTLRATVDWSHSMLSDIEQRVFARLGCFTGTFAGSAAEAIVSGDGVDEWEVLDAIASLVAKSMVVVDHVSREGVTRYGLLETLRAYARERLDDSGEADQWRRRHARYFATFAEDARTGLMGPDEFVWRPRVRAELDNLRAAANWAIDASDDDDVECGMSIIGSLAFEAFMDMTSGVGVWATRAIPRVDQTTAALRTAVLGAAAYQATFLGDFDRAIQLAKQALVDGLPENCPCSTGPYTAWATTLMNTGSAGAGLDVMLDALDKLKAANTDDYSMGGSEATTAIAAAGSQDFATARIHADEAVGLARRTRNPSIQVVALYALGETLVHTDPESALDTFEECLKVMRAGASNIVLSPALAEIGRLRASDGDTTGAISALREAVFHSHDAGYRPMVVGALDRAMHAFASLQLDEPAAVLAGVVIEGSLAGMNHFFDPVADEREAALRAVQSRLGNQAYLGARGRGTDMGYDDVIQYALQLFDDLLPEELADKATA